MGSKHQPTPPTTLHGDTSAIYPSASFSRGPFFPFLPHTALGEEEMGDVDHQQPDHILDTEVSRLCGTLGMDTKAMVQSLPVKGRSPVPH